MPIFNPILVGKQLPTLTTPGAASDLASGKQLIGQDGEIVTGNVPVVTELSMTGTPSVSGSNLVIGRPSTMRAILPYQVPVKMDAPLTSLGDAAAADVASGKTFTSAAGVKVTGTAQIPQICVVTIEVGASVGDAVSVCTNSGTSTVSPGGTAFFRLYASVGYGLVYSNTHSLPQVSVTSGTCNIKQLATSHTRVIIPTSNCTLTVT